jgi:hypothetical protein
VWIKILNGVLKLFTGLAAAVPVAAVTELNTMPHILSTQVMGEPVWAVELSVLVAQGMLIQSKEQSVPTIEPALLVPLPVFCPCILNARYSVHP